MKTIIILLVVLAILAVVVVVALAVAAGRLGKRSHQTYKGLERQRGAAAQARRAGVSRLDEAQTHLQRAQRQLIDRHRKSEAQVLEELRRRLVGASDRHRYATHGYAPLGSDTPVKEAELSQLQELDAAIIADSDRVLSATEAIEQAAAADGPADISTLVESIDDLVRALDHRKAFIQS